jgi:HK97 family phage portal protein
MGWLSGPRFTRPPAPEPAPAAEERATYWAPRMPVYIGSSADVTVTTSSAAQSVAIRTVSDLIASMTSELPITVYTGRGKSRREVPTPATLEDPGGDDTGREDWGYRLLWSWLLTGNTFGDVVDVDERGRLGTVDLLHPDDVSTSIVDGKPKWWIRGREVTEVGRFAHWRVNPVPGRLLGLSPIEHHATTIGISLATSRFGRQWFADGAHPSGMLVNELVDLDQEQAQIAKERMLAARGSSEPIVYGKGWKWTNAQVTPEESQFLETQGLSEAQCARIFGPGFAEILGYETGQKMTYSNVVDRRQDLLVFAMNRWFRRYERILSRFTPRPQWVEVNRDAVLESTTLQRFAAHASSLQHEWRTVNEIREIEHLDPVPWGDEPRPAKITPAPAANQQEAADEPDPRA